MIGNKPDFNNLIQWSWDYVELTWDAVDFVETYTFKSEGTYAGATGTYTGGTVVGYVYVKYADVGKTTFSNAYGKAA